MFPEYGSYSDLGYHKVETKKTIRMLNHTVNELKLEKHPDKTLIGRTGRGFDFLGYFPETGKT